MKGENSSIVLLHMFCPFDQINLQKREKERKENECLLTAQNVNCTSSIWRHIWWPCWTNVSLVNLYPHMERLYRWTKIFLNKWLIYILGGSIYPVHGWSMAMNLSSVDRQWDLSSESQLYGPKTPGGQRRHTRSLIYKDGDRRRNTKGDVRSSVNLLWLTCQAIIWINLSCIRFRKSNNLKKVWFGHWMQDVCSRLYLWAEMNTKEKVCDDKSPQTSGPTFGSSVSMH